MHVLNVHVARIEDITCTYKFYCYWSHCYVMKTWLIIAVVHNLSSYEIKAWKKNSHINRIWTNDFCDTSTVLSKLSYQDNWELVTLWVHNPPIDDEECKRIYERWYIWHYNTWSFMYTVLTCIVKYYREQESCIEWAVILSNRYKNWHKFANYM